MIIELMQIGKTYTIEKKNRVTFTGKVISKTDSAIRIITIRNEDINIQDEEIAWTKIYEKRNETEMEK
jgi:hypothetical protein